MLPEEEGTLRRELGCALAWLASRPCSPEDMGLIHYDLELDNLIWDGDVFHVVDFDDAMVHWYDYDVAAAVADLLDSPEPVARQGLEQFLAGYHETAPERRVRLGDLPRLRRCHELMRAARVLFALRGVEAATSPAWLRELHQRLNGWLAARREAFREPFDW